MRILVVTNLYPPHHLGGYGLACGGTVAAWRAAGHEVTVLTSTWTRPETSPERAPPDPSVIRQLPIHWDNHEVLEPSWRRRWANERQTRRVIEDVVAKVDPDVVSVWNAGGLSMGQFTYWSDLGLPVVLVVADDWLTFARDQDAWARVFSKPTTSRRAAARAVAALTGLSTSVTSLGPDVVACFASEHLRRRAFASFRWEFAHAAVVPWGINEQAFPIVEEPARPADWSGRLLYLGRIEERKGVGTILRALARLETGELEVVGSGDRRSMDAFHRLAAELDVADRVELHGEVSADEVQSFLLRADALIFSSEWDEPFGMVPVEAMASGLPVIGTGTGGSGEFLVDGATAIRYEPGDIDGLVQAIRRIEADPALRTRLVHNGLQVARWLTWDRFMADALSWHEVAAAVPGATPPADRSALPPGLGDEVARVDVRVGIVNWNGGDHLAGCLDALPAALGSMQADVVVVDNASTDGSDAAADARPDVRLVRNVENVGYAKAMNQALGGTTADVLVALNPDTVPGPGAIEELVRRLREQPDVGLVVPRLTGTNESPQDSVRRFPSLRLGLIANLLPGRLLSTEVRDRHWLDGAEHRDRREDIEWAIGAVHVIRRAAVATERPYRERWFIYVEDVDLCWRLHQRGWRVRLEGDVAIHHVGNVSGAQAFGNGRTARWLRETYDWLGLVRGRLFARAYALLSAIGTLVWLVTAAVRRSPTRQYARNEMRGALSVHLRTAVFGPAPPAPPPRSPDELGQPAATASR